MTDVSLLLFAYNQAPFVEEAVRAALAQDPPPREVVISDDGSTDGTADRIERMLTDHRGQVPVRFLRQAANRGLAACVNAAVAAAAGDVVVMAAGDDASLPGRCGLVAAAFDADPALACLFSNSEVVDEGGRFERFYYDRPPPPRTIDSFRESGMGLLGATVAFRRSLFDLFGPLDDDLVFEDRVIPLRAALAGRIGYVHEPLVRYRRHGSNVWLGADDASRASRLAHEGHLARRNRMMIAVFRNRLRDLDTGTRLFPGRRAEIARVRRLTRGFLRRARLEEAMWAERRPARRLLLTARALAGGLGPRAAWGWVKRFHMPALYHRGVERRRRGG